MKKNFIKISLGILSFLFFSFVAHGAIYPGTNTGGGGGGGGSATTTIQVSTTTLNGPTFIIGTSTQTSTFDVQASGTQTIKLIFPPKNDSYFAPSSTIYSVAAGSNISVSTATGAAVVSGAAGVSIPTNGLIGQYAFQDGSGLTLADSSGNGNNGTLGDEKTITQLGLNANVVTVVASNDFVTGDVVQLSGLTTNPTLNSVTGTVLASGLTGSQFRMNLTNTNIATSSETGIATARIPAWVSTAGAGGLIFTGHAYNDVPSGNSAAGGTYVKFPSAINSAKSAVFFLAHQPLNPQPFTNFGGLLMSNSGTAASTSAIFVVDTGNGSTTNGNNPLGLDVIEGFNGAVSYAALTPGPIGTMSLGYVMGAAASSTNDAVYINGISVRQNGTTQTFNPNLGGVYQLGGSATVIASYPSWFTGTVYYALFYNRPLTQAEMTQISSYLQLTMNNRGVTSQLGITSAGNMIVSDGDSIQAYNGGWFLYNTISTTPLGKWNQGYVSVSGDGATLLFQRSWADDQLLPPSSPLPTNLTPGGYAIDEFMIGTNSLAPTQTSTNALNDIDIMAAYARARRNAGWNKIVQSTIMDQTSIAAKDFYNTAIRGAWTTYDDALEDVAADPALGADGSDSNGHNNYYFGNGVHPSVAGQKRIAVIKSRVINHLIGNTLTSGVPNVAGATVGVGTTTLTSNVATYTTTANHHFQVGEKITVTGLTTNTSTYDITGSVLGIPAPNQFTFSIATSNIATATNIGTALANPFTMQDTDTYIQVNHASGSVSVYLPDALGYTGQSIWIKNLFSNDTGTVTLFPPQTLNTLTYAVASTSITTNVLTVLGNNNFNVGDLVTFSGLGSSTFLNAATATILTVIGGAHTGSSTGFTANFTHADYSQVEATGTITVNLPAETIDGQSSFVLSNGTTLQLQAALVSQETGLDNWITVGSTNAASSFITPTISGAITGPGCDTATSSVDTSFTTSTIVFDPSPLAPPGPVTFYTLLTSSGIATTYVCSGANITPSSTAYLVKIIR